MVASDLAIAELLGHNETYSAIAKNLRGSPKRISSTRKLIDEGSIVFDKTGKAIYAQGHKPGMPSKDFSDRVNRIARILGVEDPLEALDMASGFLVKLNPYIIFHGVKRPEELIAHFEEEIAKLNEQIETCRSEIKRLNGLSEYDMAKKMGLGQAVQIYEGFKQIHGYGGSLTEFLSEAARYVAMEVKLLEQAGSDVSAT